MIKKYEKLELYHFKSRTWRWPYSDCHLTIKEIHCWNCWRKSINERLSKAECICLITFWYNGFFSKICITLTFNSQSPSCNIFSWSSNSLTNVVIASCYGYCEIRFLLTCSIWFYFINSVNSEPEIFYNTGRLVKLKIQRKVLNFNKVPVTGESSLSRETRPTRAPCWKRRGKEGGRISAPVNARPRLGSSHTPGHSRFPLAEGERLSEYLEIYPGRSSTWYTEVSTASGLIVLNHQHQKRVSGIQGWPRPSGGRWLSECHPQARMSKEKEEKRSPLSPKRKVISLTLKKWKQIWTSLIRGVTIVCGWSVPSTQCVQWLSGLRHPNYWFRVR